MICNEINYFISWILSQSESVVCFKQPLKMYFYMLAFLNLLFIICHLVILQLLTKQEVKTLTTAINGI